VYGNEKNILNAMFLANAKSKLVAIFLAIFWIFPEFLEIWWFSYANQL
jgi:hypothetical protein